MIDFDSMQSIVEFIRSRQRFAVTSHVRPDGDSIGSSLGLAQALEQLGKSAGIFHADPTPAPYATLPGSEEIRIVKELQGDYEGVFILECSDLSRTGLSNLHRYPVINIDHHPKTVPYGQLNWFDISASAVGEMIYELVQQLEIEITPAIATNLYVAILTDTGSFQHSNTTAKTFEVAAKLVKAGANPGQIAQAVFMNQPHVKIQLLGHVLSTLTLHSSRKIAWVHVTRRMLREVGAEGDETEGVVNYALSMQGVFMVAFFREQSEGVYRISLRSKNEYDVGSVAEIFGGGGHRNAAGLTVHGSFEDVRSRVVRELEKLLDA